MHRESIQFLHRCMDDEESPNRFADADRQAVADFHNFDVFWWNSVRP